MHSSITFITLKFYKNFLSRLAYSLTLLIIPEKSLTFSIELCHTLIASRKCSGLISVLKKCELSGGTGENRATTMCSRGEMAGWFVWRPLNSLR